jgi:tetratricopeptide (TPR) repeat protein
MPIASRSLLTRSLAMLVVACGSLPAIANSALSRATWPPSRTPAEQGGGMTAFTNPPAQEPQPSQPPGQFSESSPGTSGFSRFLQESGETALWLDDLLARWRDLEQASQLPNPSLAAGDIAAGKLEIAFEISRWLEPEIPRIGLTKLQASYPQLWHGPQASRPEFAIVRLILLQQPLNDLGTQALGMALRDQRPRESLEAGRDLQRQLRAVVDELGRAELPGEPASAPWQSLRLRQLKSAAEANLAWAFYYEWLLQPRGADDAEELLRQAAEIFMRQLGVTEPDLAATDSFRWYDPSQLSADDHLLGLGLCAAGQARWIQANTCFATLQQQADPDLSRRVVLWQAHNFLKQQKWEDAQVLTIGYLQNGRSVDAASAARTVDVMLSWFLDPVSKAPTPTVDPSQETPRPAPLPPDKVAVWAWRLLEHLIQRGQIDDATTLLTKYHIRIPETGLASQVLQLNQLLAREPPAARSRDQWTTLAEALGRWAFPTSTEGVTAPQIPPVIQRWAKQWLSEAKRQLGEWPEAIRILSQLYEETPLDAIERRQEIAWQLAQWHEARREWDAESHPGCLLWYRQAARLADLPLTAAAEIKVRLWELADQPLAQDAYLRSVPASSPGYEFAQRQRLTRLYERLLTEPRGANRQTALAAELQSLLLKILSLTQPPETMDQPGWTRWQAELRGRLASAETTGEPGEITALLQVWLQVLEATDGPLPRFTRQILLSEIAQHAWEQPASVPANWTPLLLAAVRFWGQDAAQEIDPNLRRATVDRLLADPSLPPPQTHLVLANTVPALQRAWEQSAIAAHLAVAGDPTLKRESLTSDLTRLYQIWWTLLQQSPEVDGRDPWAAHVAVRLADLLWRQAEYHPALHVLEACPEHQSDLAYQQQMARISSSLERENASELWEKVAQHYPSGSRDWFEAKWHLLNQQAKVEPGQAEKTYNQIGQLYPIIPPPWAEPWRELGHTFRW